MPACGFPLPRPLRGLQGGAARHTARLTHMHVCARTYHTQPSSTCTCTHRHRPHTTHVHTHITHTSMHAHTHHMCTTTPDAGGHVHTGAHTPEGVVCSSLLLRPLDLGAHSPLATAVVPAGGPEFLSGAHLWPGVPSWQQLAQLVVSSVSSGQATGPAALQHLISRLIIGWKVSSSAQVTVYYRTGR